MLTSRAEIILRSIVRQYITKAVPVSSSSILEDCGLDICSATIRNEVVRLETEGYILRPHHSAGSIPADKGYRYYVESLKDVELPTNDKFLIRHLFHQVEKEMEEWLNLTVAVLSQRVQSMAVVTMPRQTQGKVHHIELVSLQDNLVLVVLILRGAKVKQQLINFEDAVSQPELTLISNRLNDAYAGLTRFQIEQKLFNLNPDEFKVRDSLVKMMRGEDEQESREPFFDGLHYMLEQPEFHQNQRVQEIMQLLEQKKLSKMIAPPAPFNRGVQVYIGQENASAEIRDYSLIVSQYGIPDEAVGTIGVIGPTRMAYERALSAVSYLSLVMSTLVAELYGKAPVDKDE
ncbi:heat-inducible transcriptional repressor HrcA [Dehalococcoides mccartyi]|uniref:Heat-inducible transcription repressor HrcA n=1 Tax=Dehalococcoides mccartyi (strain VS) TaxID=311424 RepID=D2BIZ5_DEHMV|nr:heat-inducible transcriptional repressor HrcA [Dehalococcoides mccartyi]ACZ62295.1 heat-inducible transcription repressor [Dehalococcoides mccartyi VS]